MQSRSTRAGFSSIAQCARSVRLPSTCLVIVQVSPAAPLVEEFGFFDV
jgi:hypothetical protein